MDRALDAEVAERVMGWRWDGEMWHTPRIQGVAGHGIKLPPFSSDIALAFQVVEKMRSRGCSVDIAICGHECNGKEYSVEFSDDNDGRQWRADEATMPLAICRAALAAGDGEA